MSDIFFMRATNKAYTVLQIDHCLRARIFNVKDNLDNYMTLINEEVSDNCNSYKIAYEQLVQLKAAPEPTLYKEFILLFLNKIKEEHEILKRKILERSA